MSDDRERRVTELFLRAIELPRKERAAFLDKACGDDAGLRAEVGSLVSYHNPNTITDVSPEGRPFLRNRLQLVRSDQINGLFSSPPDEQGGKRRRRLFLATAIVAAVLAIVGFVTYGVVERQLEQSVETRLQTVLDANVASLRDWIELRISETERWAQHPTVRASIWDLVEFTNNRDVGAVEIRDHPANFALMDTLEPLQSGDGVIGVNALSREGLLISYGYSGGEGEMVGARRLSPEGGLRLSPVFFGRTVVTPPFRGGLVVESPTLVENSEVVMPVREEGVLRIVVAAPVHNERGQVVALLASATPRTRK